MLLRLNRGTVHTSQHYFNGTDMNKDQIINLLEQGAYLDYTTNRLHHASFKNGSRKVSSISWNAAARALGFFGSNRLIMDEMTKTYRIAG